MLLKKYSIILIFILVTILTPNISALKNPAAVYCNELGYTYDVESSEDGDIGYCFINNETKFNAWDFFTGKEGKNYGYCELNGFETITLEDGKNPYSPTYGACIIKQDKSSLNEIKTANVNEESISNKIVSITDIMDMKEKVKDGFTPDLIETSFIESNIKQIEEPKQMLSINSLSTLPSSFDWRDYNSKNWLTPAKDQGLCGSCWAFAAVGAVESNIKIANNNANYNPDLSEQYLVSDCSDAGDCDGGSHALALRFIRDSGITDESCFEYSWTGLFGKSCNDRCSDWSNRLTKINEYIWTGTNTEDIKRHLIEKGPLTVSMAVDGSWWGDGVYRCGSNALESWHAVDIVGYDDAGGYWIIKNSWGWHSNWMLGSKVGYGECAIAEFGAYYVGIDLDSDGISEYIDNCHNYYNPSQEDSDGDGIGNACDSDDDNDGWLDVSDSCSLNYGTYCHGCPMPACQSGYSPNCPASGAPICVQNSVIGNYNCMPQYSHGHQFYHINNISISNMGSPDASSNPLYYNFFNTPFASLEKNKNYTLFVNTYSLNPDIPIFLKTWIDFNDDLAITSNEELDFGVYYNPGTTHNFNKTFVVPSNINANEIIIRVAMKLKLGNENSPVTSCDSSNFSQTYDYLIKIIDPIICTQNITNTTWNNWQNISCLLGDKMNQSRTAIQYDKNNCGNFTNKTLYDYRAIEFCDYCKTNQTYTDWSNWQNISMCTTKDSIFQNRTRVLYDSKKCIFINGTLEFANQTQYESRELNNSCNYCSYNIINTTISAWKNQTTCLFGDYYIQNRSKTEYDSNYSSCYMITNLPTDLWNNGSNKTYWEFRNQTCIYPDKDNDGFCQQGFLIQNASLQCPRENGPYGTDCNDNNINILPPYNKMIINSSTMLCNGKYEIPYGIVIEKDNIIFNCNNSELIGNFNQYEHDYFLINSGIFVNSADNITIKNCKIKNYTNGIALFETLNSNINSNSIENNNYPGASGISLAGSNLNKIQNNVVNQSYYGITVYESSNDNMFSNNLFYRNDVVGLQFSIIMNSDSSRLIKNNVVFNNSFIENHLGIELNDYWSKNNITANNITKNYFKNQSWLSIIASGHINNIWGNDIYNKDLFASASSDNNYCINGVGNNYLDGSSGPICEVICTPSLANTTWSDWQNISCVNNKMNQSKFLTQYDSNSCPNSQNETFYEYQTILSCGTPPDNNQTNNSINLMVYSPETQNYNDRRIPFELNVSDIVDKIVYTDDADSRPRERSLCTRNCDNYGLDRLRTQSFNDGNHNVSFKIIKNNTVIDEQFVEFFVDSTDPRISNIKPQSRRYTNGSDFYIKYTEANCQVLKLFINGTEKLSNSCESGKNIEKTIPLDISEYNGQEVTYKFEIIDIANNTDESRETRIKVDTTSPEIKDFKAPIVGKYVYFNMTVLNEDKNSFNKVEYIESGLRPQSLCTSLKNNNCFKKVYFKAGTHNLIVRATDDAGNSDTETLSFTIV